MAEHRQLEDEGDSRSGEMAYVLDAARGSLEHQFAIAERLDAKARGQMTLAGAWFTVTQGVAGIVLGGGGLSLGWTITVLGAAATAAVGLVWAFYEHYGVWKLRNQPALKPEALQAFGADVRDADVDAPGTILAYHAQMLGDWQHSNHEREAAFASAVPAWFVALCLTLVELLAALVAAILG